MLKPGQTTNLAPSRTLEAAEAPSVWKRARRSVVGLSVAAALVLVLLAIWMISELAGGSGVDQPLIYYTVTRSDLPILITERGNLEAQLETTIRCEVENFGYDRSGNYGTQIIFIVPNGTPVKKGDLLVELDSAAIREKLDAQVLDYQRAVSARIQATARYENQKIQNQTALAQAQLKLELAKLELEMYMDQENGTFQLELEEIDRQIDEANNQILEARAALELEKTEKSGIEQLFRLGYRGQSDLNQSHFKYLQAEDRLAAAVNRLKTYQATRRKLETYEHQMQELQLRGAVETAERALLQVQNDNESLLQQALAAKEEAEKTEAKEKERLEKLETQLSLCKIYAPHDGMVVYARDDRRSSSSVIAEGVMVRQRQRLITLPDLSKMQVKTQIHEAVLDQVHPGLPATIRIDAFPDNVYQGVVEHVAVVPTSGSWFSSGVKTYETIVRIEGEVENLKPGMTAVVEIHVDRLRDVLAIPVQAVVQRQRDTWCYVKEGRGVAKRMLTLGRSNDKFVHVKKGLVEGDQVVLNPMAILKDEESPDKNIGPDREAPEMPKRKGKQDDARRASEDKGAPEDGRRAVPPAANSPGPRRSKGQPESGRSRRVGAGRMPKPR